MTFTQETVVCVPFETKLYRSFPKPNHVLLVPKLNQRNIDLVRQDMTCGVQAFAHCPNMLKGRLSAWATDPRGPVVHQGWFSTSAGNAKGYFVSLDKTRRAPDKMSVCDKLG